MDTIDISLQLTMQHINSATKAFTGGNVEFSLCGFVSCYVYTQQIPSTRRTKESCDSELSSIERLLSFFVA